MNQQATNGDTAETLQILTHHLECFGKLDLAGTMTDYADESKFFSPGGVLRGSESIRKFYGTLFEEFAKPGMSFDLLQQEELEFRSRLPATTISFARPGTGSPTPCQCGGLRSVHGSRCATAKTCLDSGPSNQESNSVVRHCGHGSTACRVTRSPAATSFRSDRAPSALRGGTTPQLMPNNSSTASTTARTTDLPPPNGCSSATRTHYAPARTTDAPCSTPA
jgi:hypothetical protein